jgi:NAD(P)-dependent dehydrogenase (short-subunit alcohol dehydrogenase family)
MSSELSTARRPSRLGHRRRPLEKRVALVTGGAMGIGFGICRELLHAGALVVIGDRKEEHMEKASRQLASDGSVDWVKLDVADNDARDAAIATIRARHGAIDILVNNAGIAQPGLFFDEDRHSIFNALAVDLVGTVALTRSVLPEMVSRRWGRVVNMSSMTAFTGSPGFAVYSAAKAGVLSFSEAIERELRKYPDIRVTAVLPPSVKTQAFQAAERSGLMRWNLAPPISVEQVARRTVHGLIAGRRRVYCGLQSYGASLIQRFTPWLMDAILMYMFQPPVPRRLAAGQPPRAAPDRRTVRAAGTSPATP